MQLLVGGGVIISWEQIHAKSWEMLPILKEPKEKPISFNDVTKDHHYA